jgi:hypothetical protein
VSNNTDQVKHRRESYSKKAAKTAIMRNIIILANALLKDRGT